MSLDTLQPANLDLGVLVKVELRAAKGNTQAELRLS
jgi:hypothetical protein